jgi:hypothetical protein
MNIRLIIRILLALTIIVSVSCSHDKNKIRKRDLIPVKELVPLLTDLYITDGLLQYPGVKNQFQTKDTISSYIDVIKKHGYTKARLDNTLHYYFLNDPKKLQKIYDLVLARLSELQSRNETDKKSIASNNLWDQKTSFSIPEDGSNNSVYFDIPISDTGYFSLALSAILFKTDQSVNPRITVFFWKTDSLGTQVKKMWDKTDLKKDDLKHNYSVVGRLSDPKYKHIGGFLLDCDPGKGRIERHARISDIKLIKGVPE